MTQHTVRFYEHKGRIYRFEKPINLEMAWFYVCNAAKGLHDNLLYYTQLWWEHKNIGCGYETAIMEKIRALECNCVEN